MPCPSIHGMGQLLKNKKRTRKLKKEENVNKNE